MENKKALVTGGMGFIGKHVVSQLIKEGFKVLILDNFESAEESKDFKINVTPYNMGQPIELIPQDAAGLLKADLNLIREDFLSLLAREFDHVFHLAALPRVEPSIQEPVKYHYSNVDSTLKLLNACRIAKVKKFVFSSSSSVYGDPEESPTKETSPMDPMSPYALHKLIGEEYLDLFHKLYDFNSVSLRYFNVYGAGQPTKGSYVPVMGIFFRQRRNGQPLTITGDGTQSRDFVNVEDVAKANVKAALADLPPGHHKINIASGKNFSINEIAKSISPKLVSAPARFEPHTTLGDISKAKELIDWEPSIGLMEWIEDHKPRN